MSVRTIRPLSTHQLRTSASLSALCLSVGQSPGNTGRASSGQEFCLRTPCLTTDAFQKSRPACDQKEEGRAWPAPPPTSFLRDHSPPSPSCSHPGPQAPVQPPQDRGSAERPAMSHQPVHLLGLRILPRPSIWAEPASVVPWGQPVTVRCRSPAEAETFHPEEGSPWYQGMRSAAHGTEAGFPISAANEDAAGLYRCLYYRSFTWSESSEALELVVTAPPFPNYTGGTTST
ncbi:leukocyte immunoglobulin-like receptor subfamily A member 5 isoform X1 [Hyaena hyaena]|uniref:leukocyte immunoglobulin-like receptor subfamily A member 5 isoform X1 n=1 Tax=Hyaena hyaena TaxID=95912 RepID=UPI0019239A6A|nr:leukocyte immunoglobulin-like receptor subfamily A member 5 isoform X1 [Hyaena hyaena]